MKGISLKLSNFFYKIVKMSAKMAGFLEKLFGLQQGDYYRKGQHLKINSKSLILFFTSR